MTSYTVLLVFKIVESLQCILKILNLSLKNSLKHKYGSIDDTNSISKEYALHLLSNLFEKGVSHSTRGEIRTQPKI